MSLLIQKTKSIQIAQKTGLTGEVIFDDADYKTIISIIREISTSDDDISLSSYDPIKSRKYFWQKIFGSEPLPPTISNAADLFAGSLGRDLDISSVDLQTAIDDADEN